MAKKKKKKKKSSSFLEKLFQSYLIFLSPGGLHQDFLQQMHKEIKLIADWNERRLTSEFEPKFKSTTWQADRHPEQRSYLIRIYIFYLIS